MDGGACGSCVNHRKAEEGRVGSMNGTLTSNLSGQPEEVGKDRC